jgi:hypothetical protein
MWDIFMSNPKRKKNENQIERILPTSPMVAGIDGDFRKSKSSSNPQNQPAAASYFRPKNW